MVERLVLFQPEGPIVRSGNLNPLLNTKRENFNYLVGAAFAHPATRGWMWRNVARPIVGGHLKAAKNVTGFAARASGYAAAGYVIGSAVGIGISRAAFGKQGASKAFELYKNPLKTYDAVLDIPKNVQSIVSHYF